MAGATHDDGFHEIQLNGKQLVFLFMAVTVVSVVIFLCGVLVGRGVRLDRPLSESTTVEAASVPPPPAPVETSTNGSAPATPKEDTTFNGRLASPNRPRPASGYDRSSACVCRRAAVGNQGNTIGHQGSKGRREQRTCSPS